MTNASISISDGKIYCTFIRDSITKLVLPESASAPEVTIDLNSVDYFVLLASGPLASKDQISRHKGASVSATAIKVFICFVFHIEPIHVVNVSLNENYQMMEYKSIDPSTYIII